jgi:hypothetical protein
LVSAPTCARTTFWPPDSDPERIGCGDSDPERIGCGGLVAALLDLGLVVLALPYVPRRDHQSVLQFLGVGHDSPPRPLTCMYAEG